jgi:peptidoglycan LD-endopeptidase LytH
MPFPTGIPKERPQEFGPVIDLPPDYEVYDFSSGYDPNRTLLRPFGVGKFGEDRSGMYIDPLFSSEGENRTVHMGLDFGAPLGTPVRAFAEGRVLYQGYLPLKGDYGHVVVSEHSAWGERVFALYGHLSAQSLVGRKPGWRFPAGAVIGWIGGMEENGGWNPHLHFQISRRDPGTFDMPGVVSKKQLAEALHLYIDPQMVTGRLY